MKRRPRFPETFESVHLAMPYLNPSPQVNALLAQLGGLATGRA
jgi:hypothetical protein